MMVTVAVAIPARNEQKSIASVVLLAREHAEKVLVVNDGSTDNTELLARMAGAQVITHNTTVGKGGAIATALRWARDSAVDILVFIDGDGQHDPDHIPSLIEPIMKKEADITIGSRWHHERGLREMPVHRVLGNWVLSTATSLALSRTIRDSQSGFRAFHRRTFSAFTLATETGFAVESEMITLADKAGFKWKEVGIEALYQGKDASTESSLYHGLAVLGRAMRILRIHKPIRFFGLMSFVMFLAAFGVALYSRITYPGEKLLTLGAMYLVASLCIFGAFFAFSGIMLSGVDMVSDRMLKIVTRGKGRRY